MRVKSRITLLMLRRLLPVLCLLAFLSACREASYPPVLVQADSAYVQGDYELADSLLDAYDVTTIAADKHLSMYYHLLTLERKFVAGKLTEDDFSLSDSLCRYYQDITPKENYAKALLFRGDVYLSVGEYPTALKDYIEAADIAERIPIIGWAKQCEGDLYYKQQLYKECVEPYRSFYALSVANRDTLRIARAAIRMGTVHTIENDVDSTIASFKKAMNLTEHLLSQKETFSIARNRLSDIYIQIGEYKKAEELMPRDSLNLRTWAYWHLGQNHLDSAKICFKELLKHGSLYGQAYYLRILSQIEMNQGHHAQALAYSMRHMEMEDSIKKVSQVEETLKMQNRQKLNLISSERDSLIQQRQRLIIGLSFLCVVTVLFLLLLFFVLKANERKRSQELLHEKLLRKEEEAKRRRSTLHLEENQAQIKVLQEQLREARKNNDIDRINKLSLDEKALTAESLSIEANQHLQDFLVKQFHKKQSYLHVKRHCGETDFRLGGEEWEQLGKDIDEAYNHFTDRLLGIASLSEIELRVCYLVKLKISPTAIATQLFITKGGITHIRSRMYLKITGKKGTSKDFDDFIDKF